MAKPAFFACFWGKSAYNRVLFKEHARHRGAAKRGEPVMKNQKKQSLMDMLMMFILYSDAE